MFFGTAKVQNFSQITKEMNHRFRRFYRFIFSQKSQKSQKIVSQITQIAQIIRNNLREVERT